MLTALFIKLVTRRRLYLANEIHSRLQGFLFFKRVGIAPLMEKKMQRPCCRIENPSQYVALKSHYIWYSESNEGVIIY